MSTENSTLPCCGNKVCLILHSTVFRQALEESRNSFDTIVSISCYCSCNVLLSKALHLSNIVVTQKKLWVCLLSQIYMIYKIVVYSWSWSRAKWNMITGVNSENLPSVFPEQGVKSLLEHLHPVRKWLVGVLASLLWSSFLITWSWGGSSELLKCTWPWLLDGRLGMSSCLLVYPGPALAAVSMLGSETSRWEVSFHQHESKQKTFPDKTEIPQ